MADQQDTIHYVALISNTDKNAEVFLLLKAAACRYNVAGVFDNDAYFEPANFAEMATHLITLYDSEYSLFNDAAMFAQVLIAANLRCKQLNK